MSRILFAAFGAAAYFIFFGTFLYLIAFVGNINVIPATIDQGPSAGIGQALLVNLALIAVFGIQHSVMARQGFKKAWTKIIPAPVERSVYVLFSSAALWLFYLFWLPITGTVWNITHPTATALVWALFAAGWLIVLLSTFLINHFELFGLQQIYQNLKGGAAAEPKFAQPFFYRLVRHPIYTGFLIAFWAIPHMTMGHLLFAVGMTVYILIAIPYEEKDLTGFFGERYTEYQKRVGKLFPKFGK